MEAPIAPTTGYFKKKIYCKHCGQPFVPAKEGYKSCAPCHEKFRTQIGQLEFRYKQINKHNPGHPIPSECSICKQRFYIPSDMNIMVCVNCQKNNAIANINGLNLANPLNNQSMLQPQPLHVVDIKGLGMENYSAQNMETGTNEPMQTPVPNPFGSQTQPIMDPDFVSRLQLNALDHNEIYPNCYLLAVYKVIERRPSKHYIGCYDTFVYQMEYPYDLPLFIKMQDFNENNELVLNKMQYFELPMENDEDGNEKLYELLYAKLCVKNIKSCVFG